MKGKTPKLTKSHYWWIIEEMGAWYEAGQGSNMRDYILAMADSLLDTNPQFDYHKFVMAAFKQYAVEIGFDN